MKLDYIQDPGHGWLKVPEKVLLKYAPDILDKISGYSYHIAGVAVYLEEDCDMALFLNAVKPKTVEFRFMYSDKRSKIRGYSSYNRDAVGLKIGSRFYLSGYTNYTLTGSQGLRWLVVSENTGQTCRIRKEWIADQIEII